MQIEFNYLQGGPSGTFQVLIACLFFGGTQIGGKNPKYINLHCVEQQQIPGCN
jgi:hypothetical protein